MNINYYYSLLKSTADPEILAMPIEALGLRPAVLNEIQRIKEVRMGVNTPAIKTIGDLIEYGYSGLVSYFSITKPSYDDLRDKVLHVEEKLARLRLKFEDSDFTIGDVRVKELSPSAQKTIASFGRNMKTLDDVIIFRYGRMAQFSYHNSPELNELEREVRNFGLKIEGSPNPLIKSESFPLRPYAEYLSKEYLLKCGIDVTKKRTRKPKEVKINIRELSREDILETDVRHLGIFNKHVSQLNDLDIMTIGDLVWFGESELREHFSMSTVRIFQKYLAMVNLKIEGSTVEIENGQIVLKKRSAVGTKNGLTPSAPEKIDVMSLSDEEREKFLSTLISEFGFSEGIKDDLKNHDNFKTIKDLLLVTKKELRDIMQPSPYENLIKALKVYNLRPKEFKDKSIYYNVSKINPEKKFSDMNEDEKAKFLEKTLEEIGFKKPIIDLLSKFETPVTTIGALTEKSCPEIHSIGGNDTELNAIRKVLRDYGVTLKRSSTYRNLTFGKKRKGKPKVGAESAYITKALRLRPVLEMKEEERKAFMQSGLEELGLTTYMAQKFKDQANINTIEELLNCTPSFITRKKKIMGSATLQRLRVNLGICGLSLKSERDKHAELKRFFDTKVKQNNIGTESVSKQPKDCKNTEEQYDMEVKLPNINISLDDDISVLKITPIVTGRLRSGGVNKVRELTIKTHKELNAMGLNAMNIAQVQNKLKIHGLSLKLLRQSKSGSITRTTLLRGDDLLSSDIKVLYLSPVIEGKLRKINVNVVKELTDCSFTDLLNKGLNPYNIKKVQDTLSNVQLSLKQIKKSQKESKAKTKHEYIKPTESGEELLVLPVERLEFNANINEKLKAINVQTIGDLTNQTNTDLIRANITYTKPITKKLEEVGLRLKQGVRGKKKSVNVNTETEIQPQTIEKPKTRKEQVEAEFVEFVKDEIVSNEERTIRSQKQSWQEHSSGRVLSSEINPEFKETLRALETGLKMKGIWALYDVDYKYFASCSLELEEIKEIMRKYFDLQFKNLIMTATSEDMLTAAEKKIEKESNAFETIVEQKQVELKSRDGVLSQKKILSANAMRKKIFDRINRFYHDEFFHSSKIEDIMLDENQMKDE